MGKRGIGSTKIARIDPPKIPRPSPLWGMTERSRSIWKRICKAYPPDHFKPQQYDLLRMYCESAALNKIAMANAAKENYENPHWLNVADKAAARCVTLCTKLGIAVNSTMAARGKGGSAPKPKSKFEGLLYGAKDR